MSYRYGHDNGEWDKSRRDHGFHEKAWFRKNLPAWDAKWQALSPRARLAFLNEVKGPSKSKEYSVSPSVSAEKIAPQVLKELTAAGFVTVQPSRRKKEGDRVFAADGIYDFAVRVRSLRRYHLLAEDGSGEFKTYVNHCYYTYEMNTALTGVLRKAGIEDPLPPEEQVERYVLNRRWPGWVASSLKDSLAETVLDTVQEAGGPVLLADLPGRIPGSDPAKVRSALDKLVAHMALFEDLQGESLDLVVGLLPVVREAIESANKPRECPPLVVRESPRAVGPDGSVVVSDLRAYLLELSSEPPRLRQDGMLFQKEVKRFLDILEPLPEWLTKALKWTPESRLNQAHNWALTLNLVKEKVEGKEIRLLASPKGKSWMASSLGEQHTEIYNFLRAPAKSNEQYAPYRSFLFPNLDPFSSHGVGDSRFLGAHVTALKGKKGRPSPYYWDVKPEDHQALRDSVHRALDTLPAGVFHRADSILAHLAFGANNPLHLGLERKEVSVYWDGRPVPPLDEQREEAAQRFLNELIGQRLVPMGCLQAAVDDQGHLCLARTPRLDAYFGRAGAKVEFGGASAGESRVVVQPDFSIIIIGLNPAPAADLAPFCVRTTKNVGSGAMVLKLTRDSVVKAVGHGLKASEILDRLKRHASNELPANVLHEVRDWCGWVRQVAPEVVTILRCRDRETADRVLSALGKQAERLGDTMVALPQGRLSSAERSKLQSQGIIVSAGGLGADKAKPKAKKTQRRRSYYYDD